MLFRSAALGLQLAFLHSVGAQTSTKRIAFYSMEGCDANRGDPELLVNQFYATGENAESDEDLSCRVSSWANDDWPRDRKSDRYETWVDQSSIGSGCKLLVYQVSEGFDGADRNCITEYRRLDDNNDCTKLLLPKKFGYSYCCGEGCGIEPSDSIFTKRDEPSTLSPVSSIFADKSSKREVTPQLYDVTAPKRAAPLDRVGKRQKKQECSFEGNTEADVRYWGEQLRVSPIRTCNDANGCEISYDMSWSEMTGESWGVGSEVGVNLFEIISASVSFDYTYEESQETTRTHSVKESVENGFSGFIVWEPLVACAKGKLVGDDCEKKGLTTETEDEACFVKTLNGAPDGRYGTITES